MLCLPSKGDIALLPGPMRRVDRRIGPEAPLPPIRPPQSALVSVLFGRASGRIFPQPVVEHNDRILFPR